MQNEELKGTIQKNLLDLQYNKYLQFYTTSIIILFTYFVGLAIAFITKQINYSDNGQLVLVILITSAVSFIIWLSLLSFKSNMSRILTEIKRLSI